MAGAGSPVPGVSKAAEPKPPAEPSPTPQFTTPASSVPTPKAQASRDPPSGTSSKTLPCGESVDTMSVKQLREALKERGLSSHGLLEKREFQDLLRAHLPPTTPERADATPATASVSGGTEEQTPAADESVAHANASTPVSSEPSDAAYEAPDGPSEELKEGGGAAGSGSPGGTPLKEEAPRTSATPLSAAGSTATPTDSSEPLPKTPSATPPAEGIPPSNAFQASRVNKARESAPGKKDNMKGEETKTKVRPRRTGRRVRFTPMVQGRPRAPVFNAKAEQEEAEGLDASEHEVEVTVVEGLQGSANRENWTFQQDKKGHLRSQSGTRSEPDSGSERRSRARRARGKVAEVVIESAPGRGSETKKEAGLEGKAVQEKEGPGARRSSMGSNSEQLGKAQGGAGAARVKETARRERGAEKDSDSSSDSESDSGSGSSSGSGDDSSSSDESESEVEGEAQTPSDSAGGIARAAEKKESGSATGKESPVCAAKETVETGVKASPLRGSEQTGGPERRKRGRPRRVALIAGEQAGASKPAGKRGRPVGRPGDTSAPQKGPGSRKPRAVGLKTRVKRFWTGVRARARAQEQNASILRRSRKLWRLKTAPADQAAEARKRRIEARKAKTGEDDKAFALANRQKRLEALQAKALARRAAAKLRAEKAAAKKAAAAEEPATVNDPVPSTRYNSAPEPKIDLGMQKRRRPSVSILEAAVKRQAARNLETGKGEPVGEAAQGKDESPGSAGLGSRFRVPEPEVPPGADGDFARGVSERVATAGMSVERRENPGGSPGPVKLSPVQEKSVPRKKRTAGRPGVKPQTTVKLPGKLTPKQARAEFPGGRAAERRTEGFVEDDSEEEAEKATAQKQAGAADAVGIAGLSPEKESAKAPVKKRVTGKRAARKRPTAKTNGKENVLPPELAKEKRKEGADASLDAGARKVKPLGDVYVKDEEVRVQKRAVLKEAKARRFAVERTPLRRTDRLRKKAPSAVPGAEEPRLQPDAPTESGAKKNPLEADARTDDLPLATGRKTRGGGLKAGPQKKGAGDALGKAAKARKKEVKAGKVGLKKGASQGSDAAADVSIAAGGRDGRPEVETAGKKRKSVEAPGADKEKAPQSSGKKRRVSGEVSAKQAATSGETGTLARRKEASRAQSTEAESDDEVVAKKQRKEKREKRVKIRAAESDEEDEERARKRRRKEKARASRGGETDEEEPGRKPRGKHKRRHKHGRKHRRHKHRDEGESDSERRRRKHKRKHGETEEERKQRRAERRERKRARREARRADKPGNESGGNSDAGEASGEGDGEREKSADRQERKGAERKVVAAEASDLGHEETSPERKAEASEEKDSQAGSRTNDRTSVDNDKPPGETLEGGAAKEAGPRANAAEKTSAQEETGGLSRPEGTVKKGVGGAHESPPVGSTPSESVGHEVETGPEPQPVVTPVDSANKGPAPESGHPAEKENAQPAPESGESTTGVAQSLPQETIRSTPTGFEKVPPPEPEPEVALGGGEIGDMTKPEPVTAQKAAFVTQDIVDERLGVATVSPETVAPVQPTCERADAGEEKGSGSESADESEKSEEEEWESAALDALLKFESGKLTATGEATPQSKLKRFDVRIAEEKDGVTSIAYNGAPQGAKTAPVAETELEEQTEAPASPTGGEQSVTSVKSAPGGPTRAEPPVGDVESVLDWVAAKGRCNLADVSGNFAGTAPGVLEGLLQDLLGSFDIGVDNGHYFVL